MHRSTARIIPFLSLAVMLIAPVAAHADSPELGEHKAEFNKALDEAIEAMFKPGEMDPNWNKSGVDLEQLVRAKPNQVVVEVDKDGERSITLFSDRPIADFVPPEWEQIAEIGTGDARPEGSDPIEISQLDQGYYIASRSPTERVGGATCSDAPTTARLYKRKSDRDAAMPPEVAVFIFRGMLERAKSRTICTVHDVIGDGYRTRYFLKDGRSLPVFDDMTGKSTIVPLMPTVELLTGK